jgi:hypothetical protein
MAAVTLTLRHDIVLAALRQAEAATGECAGNELANVTIDQTGTAITITNNRESRTGYPKVWVF